MDGMQPDLLGEEALTVATEAGGGSAGRPPLRRKVVPWDAVRIAYEQTQEPVVDIALRFGVTRQTVERHAATGGWTARRPVMASAARLTTLKERASEPDMAALSLSMKRILAVMVSRLEGRILGAGDEVDERDVKALTALAAAHSKVTELDRNPRSARDKQPGNPAAGLARSVLAALEATVDGRAPGLAGEAE
ncbi:helix-turn-helix domain-containing protein [Oryzibacter oryziterrae]|uniref:helix-turn-helix domain-containing protein n=1 Tax=Oryzibacter oryziterrae TaxID=2766474 RepID=UPI001F305920|nr:helix-turn-helix domain-containing protein [Oryzibacter oryziterrae]